MSRKKRSVVEAIFFCGRQIILRGKILLLKEDPSVEERFLPGETYSSVEESSPCAKDAPGGERFLGGRRVPRWRKDLLWEKMCPRRKGSSAGEWNCHGISVLLVVASSSRGQRLILWRIKSLVHAGFSRGRKIRSRGKGSVAGGKMLVWKKAFLVRRKNLLWEKDVSAGERFPCGGKGPSVWKRFFCGGKILLWEKDASVEGRFFGARKILRWGKIRQWNTESSPEAKFCRGRKILSRDIFVFLLKESAAEESFFHARKILLLETGSSV